MEENNKGKELISLLKVLQDLQQSGYKVSKEINAVLYQLMAHYAIDSPKDANYSPDDYEYKKQGK